MSKKVQHGWIDHLQTRRSQELRSKALRFPTYPFHISQILQLQKHTHTILTALYGWSTVCPRPHIERVHRENRHLIQAPYSRGLQYWIARHRPRTKKNRILSNVSCCSMTGRVESEVRREEPSPAMYQCLCRCLCLCSDAFDHSARLAQQRVTRLVSTAQQKERCDCNIVWLTAVGAHRHVIHGTGGLRGRGGRKSRTRVFGVKCMQREICFKEMEDGS
jgi:hypothetical protein